MLLFVLGISFVVFAHRRKTMDSTDTYNINNKSIEDAKAKLHNIINSVEDENNILYLLGLISAIVEDFK